MRRPCMLSATVAAVALFAAPGCTKVVTGTAVQGAGATGTKSAYMPTGFGAYGIGSGMRGR